MLINLMIIIITTPTISLVLSKLFSGLLQQQVFRSMKMTDLKDKVAIVTGASSGIGAATVKLLLKEGMKVVGIARRVERVEELGKGFEGKLFAIKADVTSQKDLEHVFNFTQQNVGPIEVLINNAANVYVSSIAEAEGERIKTHLDTNILAPILYTKEAIKAMKANNVNGSIVNINSVAGHYLLKDIRGSSFYCASKFGLRAFTESIRQELAKEGSKIRIADLSPGCVDTEMTAPHISENTPHLNADDIANAIKFVISQPPGVQIAEMIVRPTAETL